MVGLTLASDDEAPTRPMTLTVSRTVPARRIVARMDVPPRRRGRESACWFPEAWFAAVMMPRSPFGQSATQPPAWRTCPGGHPRTVGDQPRADWFRLEQAWITSAVRTVDPSME